MRNIVSPLSGFASPFGQLRGSTSPLALYAAAGITPQLVADFKGGTYGKAGAVSTFDGVLEHSRASAATYVDSTGTLQTAASGVARENHHVYNGTAWVKEGYLHEPEAATNFIPNSIDFSDYSPLRSTIVANQGISPDGTNNAYKFLSDATNNTHIANYGNITAPNADDPVVFSVEFKADTIQFVQLLLSDNAANVNGSSNSVEFHWDLSDGTATFVQAGGTSSNIVQFTEDLGNGWYRCTGGLTKNGDAVRTDTRITLATSVSATATPGFAGTGTEAVLMYGPQLEFGVGVPSSYIPTSGSTVTRAADILTLPIENIPYPEPVVIGEELFSDFATEGEWVDNGDGSWTVTNATADTQLRIDGLTTTGKHYQYSFDVTTTENLIVYSSQPFPAPRPTGSYTFNNVSTSGFFIFRAIAGTTATVSNISVREINPLAVSFGYKALVTYADDGATSVIWYDWRLNSANYLQANLRTQSTATGEVYALQAASGVTDDVDGRFSQYSPGINVPMSLASRHGSTFINVAVDGVALTADTTPTAFPDLSATDLVIAPSGGPQVIQEFIMWGGTTGDIGDVGIAEASA